MIPKNIAAGHIREAMRKINSEEFPRKNKSHRYCLVADCRHYPPKYTISLANSIVNGYLLSSSEFEGGDNTNDFLHNRGFTVIGCDCGGYDSDTDCASPMQRDALTAEQDLTGDLHRSVDSDVSDTPASIRETSTLCVALVFPWFDESYFFMPSVDDFAKEDVDFVLFPEGYITLPDKKHVGMLKTLATKLNVPLLVGAKSDVASGIRQVLLRFDPGGSDPIQIYTKHSSPGKSGVVAFEMSNWNPRDMLPTFELSGVRIGATICHDHYLGLLQRYLAKRGGVQLWLNPSYDNVKNTKWSSVLRLRAVENRIFALCTLHDDLDKKKGTHPFAFSPDGNELCAREAGSTHGVPISECVESGIVYIVDLDMSATGKPFDWSRLPRSTKCSPNNNFKEPVSASLSNGRPAIHAGDGWSDINAGDGCIQTQYGKVYVGIVDGEDILNPAKCFQIIDNADKIHARPIIWNHWHNGLPTEESDRLGGLLKGRAIECCAPIVVSDNDGIRELVELANFEKDPVRREVEPSEAVVDLWSASRLGRALKMAIEEVSSDSMKTAILNMYRSLCYDMHANNYTTKQY